MGGGGWGAAGARRHAGEAKSRHAQPGRLRGRGLLQIPGARRCVRGKSAEGSARGLRGVPGVMPWGDVYDADWHGGRLRALYQRFYLKIYIQTLELNVMEAFRASQKASR